MNRVNIFGLSVPLIFLIYLTFRMLKQSKDDKINKEVEEKINRMTPQARALHLKNSKEKLEEILNKPKTTFEKITTIIFILIFAILGLGGIIGIIYFIYFDN